MSDTGMLDKLMQLRAQRRAIADQRWTVGSNIILRVFAPDDGRSTRELEPPTALISRAMGVTEHCGSNISYCASYEVGAAVKKCVLRYLDAEIKRLSAMARTEAEEVMRITSEGR